MPKLEQDKLKALLGEPEDNIKPQPGCPDDYLLASYMEGGLSERDHIQFESHLADCAFCIERVGSLGRAGESGSAYVEPERVHTHPGKLQSLQRAGRWATAALVVLAVGITVNRLTPPGTSPVTDELKNPTAVTERSITPSSPFPEILFPKEGSLVDTQSLVFKWREVPGSLYYDIRIVSDDGEQLSRQRVWDTQWSLPPDTQLQAGTEYFVRVDAYVSEGKTISSEHTVFITGGARR